MQRWQRHKTAHPLGGNLQAHTGADPQEGRHCCATWALPLSRTAVFFSSFLPHANFLQYLPAESKRSPSSKGIKKRAFGDSQS